MDKKEFDKLLKIGGFETKKEFANLFKLNPKSVNNWGTSQNIPYWVESWLNNYIDMQKWKENYINCSNELRKANDYIHSLEGEPIGVTKDTTAEEIILADTINKTSNENIINVSDLSSTSLSDYVDSITKMQEDIENLKKVIKINNQNKRD